MCFVVCRIERMRIVNGDEMVAKQHNINITAVVRSRNTCTCTVVTVQVYCRTSKSLCLALCHGATQESQAEEGGGHERARGGIAECPREDRGVRVSLASAGARRGQ